MKLLVICIVSILMCSSPSFASDEEYNIGVDLAQKGELDKAYIIFSELSKAGDRDAQNNLGSMYLNGTGVNKDFAKAAYWYLKSAKQGNVVAQFNISIQLFNGKGIQKNKVEGYAWALMSVWGGMDRAINVSKKMKSKMSTSEQENGLKKLMELNREYGLYNSEPPSYFELK